MKRLLYVFLGVAVSVVVLCGRGYSAVEGEMNPNALRELRINESMLKRFIQAYPEYLKLLNSCSDGMANSNVNQIPQMTDACFRKLEHILEKYGFDRDTFFAVMVRVSTAYAVASMEDSPLAQQMLLKEVQKTVQSSGQSELTKKEIALVKKYLPELDALLNQN